MHKVSNYFGNSCSNKKWEMYGISESAEASVKNKYIF